MKRLLAATVVLVTSLGASAQMLPLPMPKSTGVAVPADKVPRFEVASVKVHKGGDGNIMWSSTPDGISMVNMSLTMLLEDAYEMNHSTDDRIMGLPAWAKSGGFDVQAKVSEEDIPLLKNLTQSQRAEMLRAVLEDRFHVQAHRITTDMPVYALVMGKKGSKLVPSKEPALSADGKKEPSGSFYTNVGALTVKQMDIGPLVSELTRETRRTVIDKTGLTGNYDYELKWTPDSVADAGADNGKVAAPPLFTALEEQLGLRLESQRGPVEGLVVDKVEMPSAN